MAHADAGGRSAERSVRAVALACLLALAAALVCWHLTRYSGGTATLALTLLLAPLALPLYGLRRRARRAVVAGTLLIAPYLAYGLMEAFANPGARAFALATLAASALLFLSQIAWLRTSRGTGPER